MLNKFNSFIFVENTNQSVYLFSQWNETKRFPIVVIRQVKIMFTIIRNLERKKKSRQRPKDK